MEDDGRLAQWKDILKKMADAFRAAEENYNIVVCPNEKAIAARERAMTLFNRYFDNLWN